VTHGSVLVVAAHHDDALIGAGGFLCGLPATTRVELAVLVRDYLVGGDRNALLRKVCDARDWKLTCFEERDCAITVSLAMAARLANLMNRSASLVIVPAPGRHMDHASAYTLVAAAARETLEPKQIWVCDAYKGTLAGHSRLHYEDIGERLAVKRELLAGLETNKAHRDEIDHYLSALAVLRGLECGVAAAEAFYRVPEGGSMP
jgi:LmbE family N-acetylglucosaminyl deacetylase